MGYQDELGPYFVASMISCLILGFNLLQGVRYFSEFQNDPLILRGGIGGLLFVGILYTVFSSMTSYQVLVLDFDHLNFSDENVEAVPWTFSLDPILTSLESSSVQLFYGWRLYKSCRSAVLPTLVVSCALLGFLAAIGSSVVGFEYKTLAGYLPFKWLLAIWLGSAVLADLIITGALTFHLRSAVQVSGFQRTNSILNKLILHLIANNGLTALVTLLQCTLYFSGSPWYLIFLHSLGHLYTSAVLSSLNARISIRQSFHRPEPVNLAATNPTVGEVMVQIETKVVLDSFEAKDYELEWLETDQFGLEHFQSLSTGSKKRNSTIIPSISEVDRPFQIQSQKIEELLESWKE